MKPTLSTMLIAGALIILGLNACTKQDYNPIPQTVPQQPQQAKLNLVASDWTIHDGGIYVSTFEHVLSNLLINGSRVSVYAVEGSERTLISSGAVMYMDHPLWASINQDDVTVNYSCPEMPMPFQSLHVEIVVN
jgi:hypothetical protein